MLCREINTLSSCVFPKELRVTPATYSIATYVQVKHLEMGGQERGRGSLAAVDSCRTKHFSSLQAMLGVHSSPFTICDCFTTHHLKNYLLLIHDPFENYLLLIHKHLVNDLRKKNPFPFERELVCLHQLLMWSVTLTTGCCVLS